jgi:O-antigen/teichoic acid export membrane protein
MEPTDRPSLPDPAAGYDAVASTTGASVLRGALWNGVVRLLPPIYTLVQSVVAARYLGTAGMGRQSYIAFVETIVTLALTGGLPIALLRYVGQLRGEGAQSSVRALVRWAWRLELLGAGLGGAVVLVVGLSRHELRGAWSLAAVACVASILHTVPYAVLAGIQRWRDAGIVGLVTGFVSTVATVVVLRLGGGITGMFVVEATVSVVTLVGTSLLALRAMTVLGPAEAALSPELRGVVRRYAGFTTFQVVLASIVAQRSEFFFLDHYSTPTQIALYSVPFGVVSAAARLPESLGSVFVPAVATLFGAGQHERIRVGYLRAVRLLTMLALPLSAILLASGPTLVELLYGRDYRRSGAILMVIACTLPMIPMATVTKALLEGLGRKAAVVSVLVVATVVNLVSAELLVPAHGAMGAAIANTAAQLASALMLLTLGARVMGPYEWDRLRLLSATISVVAGGVLMRIVIAGLGGGAVGLVVGVAVGSAVMLAGAVSLRVIGPDDAEWLAGVLGGRPTLARVVLRLSGGLRGDARDRRR